MKQELVLTTSTQGADRLGPHSVCPAALAYLLKNAEGLQQWTGKGPNPCSERPLP